MDTKIARPEFVQKVKAKMAEQKLGIRDLARELGVSHPTVAEFVTNGKMPSFDTCIAISEWLGQDPIHILQEVGLLPPEPGANLLLNELTDIAKKLPDEDLVELIKFAEIKRKRL